MTTALHVCRYCDGLITDPDDAVLVGHEPGISGPGWDVWAHLEHANLVGPDSAAVRILGRLDAPRTGDDCTTEDCP